MKNWEKTFMNLRMDIEMKKNLKVLKDLGKIQDQTKFVVKAIEEKLERDGLNNINEEVTQDEQRIQSDS